MCKESRTSSTKQEQKSCLPVTTPFEYDDKGKWKAQVLMLPYEETFFINEKGEMILSE